MLAEYPLTVLPSYRLPDRRPWRLVAARLLFQRCSGPAVLVGLLSRTSFDERWLPPLRTQLAQILIYLVLAARVRFVVDRPAGVSRTHYVRLAVGAGALLAWVWAPNVAWPWQLLLRIPLVVLCVRFVMRRTMRFVPTRATPLLPRPSADPAGAPAACHAGPGRWVARSASAPASAQLLQSRPALRGDVVDLGERAAQVGLAAAQVGADLVEAAEQRGELAAFGGGRAVVHVDDLAALGQRHAEAAAAQDQPQPGAVAGAVDAVRPDAVGARPAPRPRSGAACAW